MFISTITAFILLLSVDLGAQDMFGSSTKERRRSNDVALVLLNEKDGKVVEGFTSFAFKNMLSSHYPVENILTFTKEELKNCTEIIRKKKNEFRCKNLGTVSCEMADEAPWIKSMKEVEARLEKELCPKLDRITKALEEGDSIDAYSATHGGEAGALTYFANGLSFRPDIQKKFRLFYSMGCSDAEKGDESLTAKSALKAGFASFVGHKGYSISPIAFNRFKAGLGMGEPVGLAVEKLNQGIKKSALSPGTEMHVAGDPSTSTWQRPRLNIKSKYCLMNRGKVPLSELNTKGGDCVTEDIITEYFLKYPSLIDDKFCDSLDPDDHQTHDLAMMGIGACTSAGRQMPQADKAKIWRNYHGGLLRRLNANLTCVEDATDLARGLYCFSQWAGKDPKEFKGALTMQSEFQDRHETILKLMNQFSPADCQRK